jgi:uncharacterized damage-inducible protein DinB
MDLLDRLLGHDEWTTRQLLEHGRSLTEAQWHQPFDLGHTTLYQTFHHIIGNVETWTDLMRARPTFTRDVTPSLAVLLARHHAASADFGELARSIRDAQRWDERWLDVLDDPPRLKTYGGAIAHVLTHNHIHRGEIMHMLSHLGVPNVIEGDVLGWESQAGSLS